MLPERTHKPNNATLFYYNAAIWIGHRIHYDYKYVTEEEGYPGIIIDGPLQADWLGQAVTEWAGEAGRIVRLKASHRHAAYLGETLKAGGTVTAIDPKAREVTLDLYVRNERDQVITPGQAVVKFE
jgi:hydroxyacyl-ACP dehydratase HTD2-like protein with hotdog domain